MFRSRNTTLIFIGREQLVRCDFDSHARIRGLWQRLRPATAEMPELIDIALRLDSSRVGRVWILADDFWTQRLTVGNDMVAGLSETETARALAFEAESLSGQAAVDSDLGFVRLEGTRDVGEFWVLQLPHWIRNQAEASVRRLGGRLMGLLHPAGVPAAVATTESTTGWGRIETWSGVTVTIASSSQGRVRIGVAGSDSRTAAWQRTVNAWLESLPEGASLVQLSERTQPLPLTQPVSQANLSERESLETWLRAWASVMQGGAALMPLVIPPKRPTSPATLVAIAAGLFLTVGSVAAIDHWNVKRQIRLHRDEVAKQQAVEKNLTDIRKEVAELEKKVAEERRRVTQLEAEVPKSESSLGIYRGRIARLLDALARHCPDDVLVQSITLDGEDLTVHGVSLDVEPISSYTVNLGRELTSLGWSVSPKFDLNEDVVQQRKVYHFSLKLVDRPIGPPRPPAADEIVFANRGRESP